MANPIATDEQGNVWTVEKQEYGMECDHPACAILHRHLANVPFSDGKVHYVDAYHNGIDTQVRATLWHEKKITEWVVLMNGTRVGDAHDTKRDAVVQATQKPRY